MKKIITLILLTLLLLPQSFKNVFAATFDNWTYPSSWTELYNEPKYIGNFYAEESDRWDDISGDAHPFFEYTYRVLKGVNTSYNYTYIAVLLIVKVSPNNVGSNKCCKSDLFTITSLCTSADLVDGGPETMSGVTTITTNLNIGLTGSEALTASASFGVSKTSNKYDLETVAYRMPISSGANNTRKFRVEYDYYDPYRNNVAYLYGTTTLTYGVIYNFEQLDYAEIDFACKQDYVYDSFWWNSTITSTEYFSLAIDLDNDDVILK